MKPIQFFGVAVVFLLALQVSALQHVAYPAFYPRVPSSAAGDTTYIYEWSVNMQGIIGSPSQQYPNGTPIVSDTLGARTYDETIANGNDIVEGYFEVYSDTIEFGCNPFNTSFQDY